MTKQYTLRPQMLKKGQIISMSHHNKGNIKVENAIPPLPQYNKITYL